MSDEREGPPTSAELHPDDTDFLLRHCHDLEEAVGTAWSEEAITRIREIALTGRSFEVFRAQRGPSPVTLPPSDSEDPR